MPMKLVATSHYRHNGGVKAKRLYGSSTITEFWVFREEDKDLPKRWVTLEVGGRTPGERKSEAKRQAEPLIRALLEKEGVKVD